MYTVAGEYKIWFRVPPEHTMDLQAAALLGGLLVKRDKLPHSISDEAKARVRARWNALNEEACSLRRDRPKRYRKRCAAILHRANAIVKWAWEIWREEVFACLDPRQDYIPDTPESRQRLSEMLGLPPMAGSAGVFYEGPDGVEHPAVVELWARNTEEEGQ